MRTGPQTPHLLSQLPCARTNTWEPVNASCTPEAHGLSFTKCLIDPKHLFVGPRIGEGRHAKVYEGK
ncbi:hypothetical protein C1H46_027528 [Malus baccata]|uniref:Protein kinase domain-containing protein n=1 Tax=Malus baccata TaxID=106549 RepID=A0A540LKB3_MALBA|nr:hypothetical protein C1H46_027528 [Malus baccata]